MILFFGKKKLAYYDGLLIRADRGLHEQIAKEIEMLVPKGARVLDMGCGQGALSARLADLGYNVVAIDNNEEDFKAIRDAIEYQIVNFDDKDAMNIFARTNQESFDCVCGVEVIEHVENPWEYVRNLTRLLRAGGTLIITTPNITSWLSRLTFLRTGQFLCFNEYSLGYGHISPISSFELETIVQREGLQDIRISPAGTLPPLYITSVATFIYSALGLIMRPFQKRILDGWCILMSARKK